MKLRNLVAPTILTAGIILSRQGGAPVNAETGQRAETTTPHETTPTTGDSVTDPRTQTEFPVISTLEQNGTSRTEITRGMGVFVLNELFGEKMGRVDGSGVRIFFTNGTNNAIEVSRIVGEPVGIEDPNASYIAGDLWGPGIDIPIEEPFTDEPMGTLHIDSVAGEPNVAQVAIDWAVSDDTTNQAFFNSFRSR